MQILPLETKCIHCHRRFTYNLSRGRPMVCPHCGTPQIKVKKGEKKMPIDIGVDDGDRETESLKVARNASPSQTGGPVVKTGPTKGQNRSRNLDGRWRKKRSDAGKKRS